MNKNIPEETYGGDFVANMHLINHELDKYVYAHCSEDMRKEIEKEEATDEYKVRSERQRKMLVEYERKTAAAHERRRAEKCRLDAEKEVGRRRRDNICFDENGWQIEESDDDEDEDVGSPSYYGFPPSALQKSILNK